MVMQVCTIGIAKQPIKIARTTWKHAIGQLTNLIIVKKIKNIQVSLNQNRSLFIAKKSDAKKHRFSSFFYSSTSSIITFEMFNVNHTRTILKVQNALQLLVPFFLLMAKLQTIRNHGFKRYFATVLNKFLTWQLLMIHA